MSVTLEAIAETLFEIVRKSPNGVGWYGAEMRCAIPRSEFPDGLNVKDVLDALVADGSLIKSTIEGKEKYTVASS